jgi:hypothetical protein
VLFDGDVTTAGLTRERVRRVLLGGRLVARDGRLVS